MLRGRSFTDEMSATTLGGWELGEIINFLWAQFSGMEIRRLMVGSMAQDEPGCMGPELLRAQI